MRTLPLLTFAAFVGWLLLFPMGGLTIPGVDLRYPLVDFLLPHIIGLLLIGRFVSTRHFPGWSFGATLLTIVLTLTYPFFPGAAAITMPLVGFCSAFLSVRSCSFLKQSDSPLLHAGLGLIIGNLILLAGTLIPASAGPKLLCSGGLLLLPLFSPEKQKPERKPTRNPGLFAYLPFILIYQLVTGIMYGGLMPAFNQVGIAQGGELFFYMAAVGVGIPLFRYNREYLLALGILLAMLSLTCFLGQSRWQITYSMYAMQASAGCLDIFILGFLLSFDNLLEAFGIGNGTICLGLFGGHQLAVWIGPPSSILVMSGCLILTATILALYFSGHRRTATTEPLSPTAPPGLTLAKGFSPAVNMKFFVVLLRARHIKLQQRNCICLNRRLKPT